MENLVKALANHTQVRIVRQNFVGRNLDFSMSYAAVITDHEVNIREDV
jgi:hypothetical protein